MWLAKVVFHQVDFCKDPIIIVTAWLVVSNHIVREVPDSTLNYHPSEAGWKGLQQQAFRCCWTKHIKSENHALASGCFQNQGYIPPNHPILIGFSIIFTIHFGGVFPLFLVQHPSSEWIPKRPLNQGNHGINYWRRPVDWSHKNHNLGAYRPWPVLFFAGFGCFL